MASCWRKRRPVRLHALLSQADHRGDLALSWRSGLLSAGGTDMPDVCEILKAARVRKGLDIKDATDKVGI